MPPMQRTPRVNLQEFKAKFVKILGPVKESSYSGLLSSFLSFRLTKEELDRLVPLTIGKENVVLHNLFVRAIFTNVTCAEAPAPPSSDISKPLKGVRRKQLSTPLSGGDDSPVSGSPGLQGGRPNGDGFTVSPRKGRSIMRDRKVAERPSPLGNHKGDASTSSQGTASEDEALRTLENGHPALPDLLRPLQHSHSTFEHSNLDGWNSLHPSKRPRYGDVQVHDGKSDVDTAGAEMEQEEKEEEEDEQGTIWISPHIRVPLGIPFCIPSAGGPRMAPAVCMPQGPITHSLLGYSLDGDCSEATLPELDTLRQRMQQGAILDNGLDGCDADSLVVVRLALEIYLQRIIKAVIELMQSRRSGSSGVMGSCKENGSGVYAEQTASREGSLMLQQRRVNGTMPGWNQLGDGDRASEGEEPAQGMISPLDFYVAMDLNHRILGENFPILLEKALLRVYWEQ